jgi:hypothetical protein
MSQKVEAFERLMELREEMAVAVQEVEGIMRQEFKHKYQNAEAYWIAHIKSALGDMGYPTYSTTFHGALESMEEEVYEGEEKDEEEEENYFE